MFLDFLTLAARGLCVAIVVVGIAVVVACALAGLDSEVDRDRP